MKSVWIATVVSILANGAAFGQTVICVDRTVFGDLYSRVQVVRDGDVRTFTDWSISKGKQGEPTSYDIPPSAVLKYEGWDWTESDDDYDYEHINLNKGGIPWFVVVDYSAPFMIWGGYAKGAEENRLITFEGEDCTVSD